MTDRAVPGSLDLLRGAGIVFCAHLAGKALGFLYHALLARRLGPADYGVFLIGLGLFAFAALIVDLGLRWGVLRESAMANGRDDPGAVSDTVVGGSLLALGASFVGAVALFAARPWAAAGFRAPDLAWLLPPFALALPFATVGTIAASALQGVRRMTALSTIQYLLDPGVRIVTFGVLVLLGWHLAAAVVSHLVATVVVAVAGFAWLSSSVALFPIRLLSRFDPRPLLSYSVPLFIGSTLGFMLQWADTLLVGYYLTPSDVGLYGVVVRLAGLGSVFLTAVGTAFAPEAYALYGQGKLREVDRLFKRSTRWVLMCVLPLLLYMSLSAESLLALFGREFRAGVPALLILAAATLVMTGTGPAGDIILMAGRSRALLFAQGISGIVGLGLSLALIPRFGLVGAGLATGVAIALGNVMNVGLAWRFTGLQPYGRGIVRPVLAACVVAALHAGAGPLLGGHHLRRVFVGAVVWLLYPALLVLAGLETDERELLRAVRRQWRESR